MPFEDVGTISLGLECHMIEQRTPAGSEDDDLTVRLDCACPDCGGPARIADRFILYRESGPELHLRSVCRADEHFESPARTDE